MTITSATAAANQTLIADGGVTDLPPVDVGDHVQDRDDEDGATMLVVETPLEAADEFEVQDGQTVADFNPDYPADDDVVKVVYPQRSDVSTQPLQRYSFPRSRLRLETPIHDRDDDQEAATDGGVSSTEGNPAENVDAMGDAEDDELDADTRAEIALETIDHTAGQSIDEDLSGEVLLEGMFGGGEDEPESTTDDQVEMGVCYGCKERVPESDLKQVGTGATHADEEVVEHRTQDPVTGERRDTVRRTEYEHTIPKCSDCRSEGGEQ